MADKASDKKGKATSRRKRATKPSSKLGARKAGGSRGTAGKPAPPSPADAARAAPPKPGDAAKGKAAPPKPEDAVKGRGTPTKPPDAKAEAGKEAGKPPAPEARPDPHERIDGLRAWLAQVDRKLGIRTYAGAAAAVLALAAGIVALVFSLQQRSDGATKDDLAALRSEFTGVEQSATQAAQEEVQGISDRVTELEDQIATLNDDQGASRRQLQVIQDDIDDLRQAISDVDTGGGGAGP